MIIQGISWEIFLLFRLFPNFARWKLLTSALTIKQLTLDGEIDRSKHGKESSSSSSSNFWDLSPHSFDPEKPISFLYLWHTDVPTCHKMHTYVRSCESTIQTIYTFILRHANGLPLLAIPQTLMRTETVLLCKYCKNECENKQMF